MCFAKIIWHLLPLCHLVFAHCQKADLQHPFSPLWEHYTQQCHLLSRHPPACILPYLITLSLLVHIQKSEQMKYLSCLVLISPPLVSSPWEHYTQRCHLLFRHPSYCILPYLMLLLNIVYFVLLRSTLGSFRKKLFLKVYM